VFSPGRAENEFPDCSGKWGQCKISIKREARATEKLH